MNWEKVKNIQASLDRLKDAKVSEEADVKMVIDKTEVFLYSISHDNKGESVLIRLDHDGLENEDPIATILKKYCERQGIELSNSEAVAAEVNNTLERIMPAIVHEIGNIVEEEVEDN